MLHTAVVKIIGDLTASELIAVSGQVSNLPENSEFTSLDSHTLQITLGEQVSESVIESLLRELVSRATVSGQWYKSRIEEVRMVPEDISGIGYFSLHQSYEK